MNAYILPAALQILGILVIVVEIFVPSMGILSLLAAGLLIYSLVLVFGQISQAAGMLFLGVDLVAVPVLFYVGIRVLGASSLSLQSKLSSRDGVTSQSPDLSTWKGKTGKAVTNLRPAGMAMIGEKRLDVVTEGEYVVSGTMVTVTDVRGNQIIVEPVNGE